MLGCKNLASGGLPPQCRCKVSARTIFGKDHDTAIAKVLAAKHTASLQLLCTVGGNQARSDARSEFENLERSPKDAPRGPAEGGAARYTSSPNTATAILSTTAPPPDTRTTASLNATTA